MARWHIYGGWIMAAILAGLLGWQSPDLGIRLTSWVLAAACLIPTLLHRALPPLSGTAETRQLQDYLQRLVDVIPQPVYVKDAQSRYILVNDAFCKERGISREMLIGKISYTQTKDPTLAQKIAREDQEVLAGKTILKEECLPHMHTGVERYRLISKGASRDANGAPVVVGANFDITPWRVAERELKAALEREIRHRERVQQYVQRLIDVIPHPVYVKDARSHYIMVNNAFAQDRGQSKEALIGKPSVGQTGRQHIDDAVLKEDAEILAGRIILKEEHKAHPFLGQDRYRVIAKGACPNAEGEPVIVCAVFDVTAWRTAEIRWMAAKEEAERANAAKSRFLANISHELRTPMHAILGFAQLGNEKTVHDSSQERLHHYFERIAHSGGRLLNLLNDLLVLSKLEACRENIALRPMDLRHTVHEVLDECSELLKDKQLRINLSAQDGDSAQILGDNNKLMQVVRNLLANAIKFSPPHGEISLSLRNARMSTQEGHILAQELSIHDQGCGIPEAELESVFDAFSQGSNQHESGTGLGLSICRQIIKAHQGEIYARPSKTGAELVLRLPLAETPSIA